MSLARSQQRAEVAQKGPLLKGSLVTAQELDANLSPTGKQFTFQIDSDLGTFSPTSTFSSQYIDLIANGYYFDEATGDISGGQLTLTSVADLNVSGELNLNLLTTLSYQRIKRLVTDDGMSVEAARDQAEGEVLAAFHIRDAGQYSDFGSLDLSKKRDGDNILAAASSLFVYGNTSGSLSALISNFQGDLADNGVIDDTTVKDALANAAQHINPAVVATNLSAKYSAIGVSFSAAGISGWIDQDGDGMVGTFEYQVPDATPTSIFTFPSSVVDQVVGSDVSLTGGNLYINSSPVSGAATIGEGDVIAATPTTGGAFPNGVVTAVLVSGGVKIAKVAFVSSLQSIVVTPSTASQPKGLTQQFTATGHFSDTSTSDLTTNVTWASSVLGVVTITPSTGQAYAATPGATTITATSGSIVSNSITYTVTPATLQSIAISPNPSITGVGLTRPLKATGSYSDSSSVDITSSVIWSSADPNIATVNTASGLATGVALGTTAIAAISNAVTGNATINVTANTWTLAADSEVIRNLHTATLLTNGKVLVAGGSFPGAIPFFPAEAQLYDPNTDSWASAGSLSIGRELHTATLMADGKVLVVGGGKLPYWPDVDLYDPVANSWTSAAPLSAGRSYHTASLLQNGKLFVVGGFGGGTGYYSSTELYDPVTGSWSPAASLADGRSWHTATQLPNGKVLVVGGVSNNSRPNATSSAELYDPATDTWSVAANLTTGRSGHTATLLANGKVLVVGGNGIPSAELYDPATDSWSAAASLVTARSGHTATLLANGKVLVVGGSQYFYSSVLSSAELYDPTTDSWSSANNLALDRTGHAATLLPNGSVLVSGGRGQSLGLSSAELYW